MAFVFDSRKIKDFSDEAQFTNTTAVRKHKPDYQIILYMGLLMLIGLVVMYAIGPQRANVLNNIYEGSNYSSTYFFTKQAISLAIALAAFFAMAAIPYVMLTKRSGKLVLISLGACALLAVADLANLDIAQHTLGATRWFNLGPLGSLQPAEMLKFAMLIFTAGFLGNKVIKGKINDRHETLIPLAILTAVSLFFIIVIQKDFGTGIALASIVLAMLAAGGISLRNTGLIFMILAAGSALMIISAPHRIERVLTYFQGDSASSGDSDSYHVEQAKLAIGTGGLFGVGIGNSVQSTGYLPEAINDSVFAIMGETFGFVGSITILAIITALLMRMLKIMDHLVDIRLKLLVAGVFGWFGSHVMLNIASMLGVAPLTGITLPLLSLGGTSMLFIAAALGLVFQLSHYTVYSSKLKEAGYENISSRRGIGRSRHSGRGSFTRN